MAAPLSSIETAHEDMIHDAQMDFYGKRLATCSSDHTVRIFLVEDNDHKLIQTLRVHEGPVWQVAWAHPKFGNYLATCGYDRRVVIWKEGTTGWENTFEYREHDSSVNTIAWAPYEYGQMTLACGSSDGDVSILHYQESDGSWQANRIQQAHATGVTCLSWAPAMGPGSALQPVEETTPTLKLVSGGCDNSLKIWTHTESGWSAGVALTPATHKERIRDVAWAPSLGLSCNIIASCSQDGKVVLWTQQTPNSAWEPKVLEEYDVPVWRVSWSMTGNVLAVSSADNKVVLYKSRIDGTWHKVSTINEPSA